MFSVLIHPQVERFLNRLSGDYRFEYFVEGDSVYVVDVFRREGKIGKALLPP